MINTENVSEIAENIYMIDIQLYSIPKFGSVYFLNEDKKVLVDTGPTTSSRVVLEGINESVQPYAEQALIDHTGSKIAGEDLSMDLKKGVLPLRIQVPKQGMHFRLEKLFANQGEQESEFSIRYTTAGARTSGGLLFVLGCFMLIGLIAGRFGFLPVIKGSTSLSLGFVSLCTIFVSTNM